MRHWRAHPPRGLRIVPQYRSEVAGLVWSPLAGPDAFVTWAKDQGGVAGLIFLSGVTPGRGAPIEDNVALMEAGLHAAFAAGVGRMLVASSSAVYGAGEGVPLTESAPTHPVNDYGRAKHAAEALCVGATDIDLCRMRIGNVAGADALLLNVPKATADAPFRLDRFADGGGPVRSYIGPATLALVLETLARHEGRLPEVLNIGAPRPLAMQDLLAAAGAPFVWVPAPATALQHITLNCAGLAALHDFAPSNSDPAAMVAQWQDLRDVR